MCVKGREYFFSFFPAAKGFFFFSSSCKRANGLEKSLSWQSLYIYIKKSKGAIAEFCEQELGVYIIFVGWYSFFVL